MRTTSYLALSRQAALERQMATDREQSRQCHDHGLPRRAHGVRGDRCIAPAASGSPSSRMSALRATCRRGRSPRPAIRSIWRSKAPATSPSRPMAGRATGGPAASRSTPDGRLVDSNGRAAARRWRQRHPPGRRTRRRSRSPATGRCPAATGRSPGSASMASPMSRRFAAPATGCSPRPGRRPPAEGARVVQGALEGSNVQPVLEMTTMLASVRAFEGAQRLLDTEHELERQAIERAARAAG